MEDAVKEAVMRYQEFAGIEMNGNIDDNVKMMMASPRCGVPDVLNYKAITSWPKNSLTYSIRSKSNKLNSGEVSHIIRSAFDIWTKYVDLKFTESARYSDINIHFFTGDHADGSPFDGPGSVLGHALFPPYGILHFDDDEDWNRSIQLFQVAAHEIGHVLGLDHSTVKGSLMFPYYNRFKDFTQDLHQDDIDGIRSLYDENQKKCRSVTSIVLLSGKYTIFFGAEYYRNGVIKKIIDTWPIATNNMNKMRISQYEDSMLFFHGLNYTKIENGTTVQRVIKTQFGISGPVDAVVNIKGRLYFFKSGQYWVFNPNKYPRIANTYPKSISDFKFPADLDTVYYNENRNILVAIKNNKVYMYNFMTKSVSISNLANIFCF
ncbi:PREDICTED: matrix metalloproteinase-18-like isoform X2 [Nicrophorus vespilloides]|nr:PREDICTED: matrix metalloproteinase-18-like isoform X2 [Nicrophorus vespilloides]